MLRWSARLARTITRLTPEQRKLSEERAFAEFARRKQHALDNPLTAERLALMDEQASAQIAWRKRLRECDPKDRNALGAEYTQDMEAWFKRTGFRLRVFLASDIVRLPR